VLHRRPSPLAVAGVAVLLAASGCGGVEIRDTGVAGSARRTCESLVEALPARVDDQPSTGSHGTPVGEAWGDPAIVLRCGVGRPADYDPLAGCQTANGVDWYVPLEGMNDQSVDVVMTTIGRSPSVEVTLPAQYRPPTDAMVDLAPVIKAHTRTTRPCS
jgi:hypothetical protein